MDETIAVALIGLVREVVGAAVGIDPTLAATNVVTAASESPKPWYESQAVGVVAGALVAVLGSWLQAGRAARTADRQAAERRAVERVELRRDSRKAAAQAFLVEVRKAHESSRRFEEENGLRYGDVNPEMYGPNASVEDALADVALEVPDNVYAAAVRLRDVLRVHVWRWDTKTKEDAHVNDEDVEAAEDNFRRLVRDLLDNN